MAIDRTPRRTVDPTIVAPAATIVESLGDSPLLSGADLAFHEPGGASYVLHTARLIGAGSQGSVVVAEDESGASFAAKISWQPQSARDRIARRTIIAYLRSLVRDHPLGAEHYRQTHLMPILASGTVTDSVPELGETLYDVAVMPICDSALAARAGVTYEEIRDVILPQAAEALRLLHEQRIVHRDVKPKNLYMLNGSLVLGDFGISSVLDAGRDTSTTKIDRRTPGYSPHSSVVMCENDWYSLGYTIWTLYNDGRHPHQALIDADDMSAVLAGKRPVPFVAKEPAHESLGALIFGLTEDSSTRRLGYDDIQRWLADPEHFTYDSAATAPASLAYQFEGTTYTTRDALAQALSSTWQRAQRHLYTHVLDEHFRKMGENDLAVALNDLVEVNDATMRNHDLGLARAIALISQDWLTVSWKGQRFGLLDVNGACERGQLDDGELQNLVASGLLGWQVRRCNELEPAQELETLADRLAQLEEHVADQPEFVCAYARMALSETPASCEGCQTPDDLFQKLAKTPAGLYERVNDTGLMHRVMAFLALYSSLRNGLVMDDGWENDNPSLRLHTTLTMFDLACSNPEPVRAFNHRFGRQGSIAWLSQHTDLYRARTAQARASLKTLKDAPSIAATQVIKVKDVRKEAFDAFAALRDATQSNPYVIRLGLADEDPEVKPTCADACFSAWVCDIRVPRGYARAVVEASAAEPDAAARLRAAAVEAIPDSFGERASSRAQQASDSLKRAAEKQRRGLRGMELAKLVGKIALAVVFVLAACMVAYPTTLDVWTINYEGHYADLFGGMHFAGATYAWIALAGLVVAASGITSYRVAVLVQQRRSKATASRTNKLAGLLASEAKSIRQGSNELAQWWRKGSNGPIKKIADAKGYEAACSKATESEPSAMTGPGMMAYWGGAAVSAAATTAFTCHQFGVELALSPEVAQLINGIVGFNPMVAQVLIIVFAAAGFAALAYFLRERRGILLLAALLLTPFTFALAQVALEVAFVLAIIALVLAIVFR